MDLSSNLYLVAAIISVCYMLLSIIEMRFMSDETRPLKEVFKSTLLVFFSTLCGIYVISNMSSISPKEAKPTEIFTGNPEF